MAAPTRILLIRHAHHDSGGRFTQHSCGGLTDRGRQEAGELGRRLAGEDLGPYPTALSSRARRAEETAEIVAARLGVPFGVRTCDLCEMHPGQAEGLTPQEMQDQFGPNYSFVPGAEYFPEWLPSAVERLRSLVARHEGQTILAFTHVAVVKAGFVAFSGTPADDLVRITPANCAISEWTVPGSERPSER